MNQGPFGNCKQAQLHKILQIQGYGGMIVVDKLSHTIVAASDNIADFVGKTQDQLLGQQWSIVLTPAMVQAMLMPSERDASVGQFVQTQLNGKDCGVTSHCVEHYCIVEIEVEKAAARPSLFSQKTDFLIRLSQTKSERESAILVMEEIAQQINFDRVMLYQFLPGWHGQVVAEKNKPRVDSYLGLRFPEGDLPANARRIFTLNLQRLIADVNAPSVAVKLAQDDLELDLTWAQLRAVHPVHIKYLKNMGVEATFSLSLVCGGKLWGMIACHNLSPKSIDISQRYYCEELVRVTALHMNSVMAANLEQKRYGYRVTLSEIRGAIHSDIKGVKAINAHIQQIKTLFNAQGIWHHLNGVDTFSGNVPDQTSLSLLQNWLDGQSQSAVTSTDKIPQDLAMNTALIRFCSGLLYIPLSQNDFILVMREEQVEDVEWAGKPHSLDANDQSIMAFTPRASFQKWSEQVKGASLPWHPLDIESAELLRTELIDYLEYSEMETMALKDPLTGLANRLLFERELKAALTKAMQDGQNFAVYMIDLDNFKPVNDTLGHAAGDEVLKQVSKRMSALLRQEDTVARLGGDEFAVILSTVSDQQAVDEIAARLLQEIKQPIDYLEQKIVVGASIGVSVCPQDAATQNELIDDADLALYEVKKAGRNGYRRFDRSMLSEQQAANSRRGQLEAAFEQAQFAMTYQPIIDVRRKRIFGFESFCVWHHPKEGLLKARDFVDTIEQNQLSPHWVKWGLKTLFAQYQQWYRAGLQMVPLYLNLTGKQFLNIDILGLCIDLAKEFQVNTSWLRLDVDEQMLIMSPRQAEEKIKALSELGILINIDHFGNGLLSLSQLSSLKVNAMKINGAILAAKESCKEVDAQITIFQSISKVINVPIIVTQVEDKATFTKALENGLNRIQGYLVAKPMPAEDAQQWLTDTQAMLEGLKLDK